MAAQRVNVVTAGVLLSVLFVSGALAGCSGSVLNITAPKEMEALSGSCLRIPCNFSADPHKGFNSSIKIIGVWIKSYPYFGNNPGNVIYNSSRTVNTYPMEITGNLNQNNCTTLFSNLTINYTNRYYFRIESQPFRATVVCDPLQIRVTDSPPRPSIEIPSGLKEHQIVTVTCSASTPCPHSPPTLTWSLQQDAHSETEENPDGTFTTKVQSNITLSDQQDGLNITCSARYPVNEGRDVRTAEDWKTLSVSYAPKNTSASISPPGPVSAGSWVNLTCSSRAKPPVSRFTWFKKKSSTDKPINVSDGAFYSFNVTHGGVYYCEAINDLGNQTSLEIYLNVAETSDSSLLWAAALGGTALIVLICLGVCVWRIKPKHQTHQKTQSQGHHELALQTPAEEDLHYGEIDFSGRRSEPSASVQDCGQQQDTLYAQVNVSKAANSLRQTADGPEDLYAQVKKR